MRKDTKQVLFLILFIMSIIGVLFPTQIVTSLDDASSALVVILVDPTTYAEVTSEITRFSEDITNDMNAQVIVETREWTDGFAVRDFLIDKYQKYHLLGAILIGDIPTIWFSPEISFIYDGVFPSDYLFWDLQCTYAVDAQGHVNQISPVQRPDFLKRDIWVGRIKPPTISTDDISLLKNYFERNHEYRTQKSPYDESILYYPFITIEQSSSPSNTLQQSIQQEVSKYTAYASDDITIVSSIDTTGKDLYLAELSKQREWVVIYAHGTPTSQDLAVPIYRYQIQSAQPGAMCYSLLSCSNGNFTRDNYLGGWYLFEGEGLVVYAFTAQTQMSNVHWYYYALPLSAGVRFGEAALHDQYLTLTILGDPTLQMRRTSVNDFSETVIDHTSMTFGDVTVNESKTVTIPIKNIGSSSFILCSYYSYKNCTYPPGHITQGIGGMSSFVDPFILSVPHIEPQSTADLTISFRPRVIGKYAINWTLLTNDPQYPYLTFYLTGNGVISAPDEEPSSEDQQSDESPGLSFIIVIIVFLLVISLYGVKLRKK